MNPVRTLLALTLLLTAARPLAGAAEPGSPATGETWEARPGPWGVLRCTRIRLRAPLELLERITLPATGAWAFPDLTWSQVDDILQAAPLTDEERTTLRDPRHRETGPDGTGVVLQPPDSLRLALAPAARAHLYDRLAAYAPNPVHALPFVLPEDPTQIARANLNPTLSIALEQLTFRRGQRSCLVDADLLATLTADRAELQRLKRLLFTVPSISVELDRRSLVQRPEVLAYWSSPTNRSPDAILRLLERSPEIKSVDLMHLLPSLPRRLLNSYAGGIESPADANCFWLALNFFAEVPDPRYLAGADHHLRSDDEEWRALERHYVPVTPPYRFGDLIGLFADGATDTELIHLMVYLADDLVLTKNGSGYASPFVLMRLGDVDRSYAWVTSLTPRGFRLKPAGPAGPARQP